MNSPKRILLIGVCLASFSVPCFAQVLDMINPLTNTSTVTIAAGGTFTLQIEIFGPVTTPKVAGFDVTLSGSSSSITPLPTGIIFDGYSNLITGFNPFPDGSDPNHFTGLSSSTTNDVPFSPTVPVTLITATFTVSSSLSNGTYAINFPPPGGKQGLDDSSANPISYTAIGATIDVVPEPKSIGLLLMGLAMIAGFRFRTRSRV